MTHIVLSGMARFCTERYVRPNPGNLDNLYAHLTNHSLNKINGAYVHSKSLREQLRGAYRNPMGNTPCQSSGSKRLLSTVFHQMEHRGVKTRHLWREIKLMVVKTVLAMVPEIMLNHEHEFGGLRANQTPRCFQVVHLDPFPGTVPFTPSDHGLRHSDPPGWSSRAAGSELGSFALHGSQSDSGQWARTVPGVYSTVPSPNALYS